MGKKIIITNRAISPLEKIAYKNLRDYDGGEYQVKHTLEISEIIFENNIVHNYNPVELDITKEQIDEYVLHAQLINLKHSDFKPGIFAERNSYDGTPSTSELLRPIKIIPIARPLLSFSTNRVATAMATTVAIPPLAP